MAVAFFVCLTTKYTPSAIIAARNINEPTTIPAITPPLSTFSFDLAFAKSLLAFTKSLVTLATLGMSLETVTGTTSKEPDAVAVITALPATLAVTFPFVSTEATCVSELDHVVDSDTNDGTSCLDCPGASNTNGGHISRLMLHQRIRRVRTHVTTKSWCIGEGAPHGIPMISHHHTKTHLKFDGVFLSSW